MERTIYENTIERAVILARDELITLDDLLIEPAERLCGDTTTLSAHLDDAARRHIEAALRRAKGVRVDAARALGVERTTLYRLIKKYGIDPEAARPPTRPQPQLAARWHDTDGSFFQNTHAHHSP